MKSICGAECDKCELYTSKNCKGCSACKGSPFGKKCWIASYIEVGNKNNYNELKKQLISEFNSLDIPGMPRIDELYELHGSFVNLEYPLPNGKKVKLLNDDEAYLGNQVECVFNDEDNKKCFGIISNLDFILVCEYGEDGINPEIIVYKKR